MTKNYKRFLALLLTLLLVFGAMPGSFSVRADNPAVEDEIISESPPMAENDGVPLSPEELQAIAAARPANAAEMVDTDLDGIPDIWETNGADYNSDGIVDFPLHQMGCEVGVRDVFVEVDWMEGMHDLSYNFNDKGVLVSKTNQQMLEMTAEEFGRHGINLHIDFGPGSIDYVTGIAWDDYPGGAGGNAFPYSTEIIYDGIVSNSAWTALSEENLTYLRSPVFHHSMFVNSASIGGWGGWGNVSGMRTLVIDGRSFMHELGHNLGLSHGGFGDGDNYKPNYLSCMNYGYTSSDFLFSECILPDLDENNLSEPVGIDPGSVSSFLGLAGSSFFYRNALKISFPLVAGKPVDYNGNGNTTDTGIVQDINNDGKLTVLKGSQDWENLRVNCNGVGSLVLLRMYTVSYNTTGGSTAPASQQKLKNQSLHLSSDIPTHDRLTFAGWSTTLGGAVEYAPGALFNIDASTTLYAVWTANENEFTLMLDKNNSSATISSVPIEGTVNGMVKISSTLPACVGSAKKDFVGWALSPSAQVPDYLPGEEISLSEDTTLYGVWSDSTILTGNTAGTCMLDFKYPNQIRWVHLGTGWEENNWTITFQNATSMPTQYAIVKGTSLSGTSWTASALTSSSQNLFSAGTVVPATDYWIKVTANTTNTALISPVAFSVGTSSSKLVSYWANGGTDAPPPALKQDDVPFTISSDVPTREGYIFMGWSTVLGTGTVSYQPGAVYNSNLNLRLFAVWESYTIGMQRLFIDLQGGSPSGFPNVLLTDENGKVTLPAAPTHVDRKNFVGYAESPDAEQYQYLPGETITIRRENTLYALWKDAPQASQSSPVKLDFYYPGQVIWINFGSGYNGNYSAYVRSTYSAILGVTRTLNGSAASWTTDASNPKYLNAGAINASQDVWFRLTSSETNPDLKWETVFSLWENSVAHHTICYFANNGINAPAPQIKMTGTSITLSSETPTRQGYTFKGWGTTAGATVAAYQPGASYSTNSHLALFAIWESNSILSITSADSFNAVGGIGGTFQVTTDSLLPLSYSLSGTVPSGVTINSETGLITILPQTAAGIYNFTVKVSDGVSPDAVQNFTLTVTDYTVKFMNGETEFESKRFAYNTDLSLPTGTPVKVSDNYNTYSFKGWFTSSEGGTQVTAATKVTADAIYYAQFTATPIIYTITFNYNGVYDTKTTTYNGTVTLPAAPTKAADSEWTYEFAGWFTQEEGGTQFTASTPVTANITVFAQWQKTAKPHEHTWNAWYTVTQATCTATGIERHDCTSCDEFQTRETAKLAHIDENKDAHCDICSADMSEDTCGCCSEHNHDLNSFFGRFACWFCKLWQMILRLFGKA